MLDRPTSAYVFYVDGYAKIGHTSDMSARLYHIMWGERPAYVEAPVGRGDIIASQEFPTKAEAVSVERGCQDALNKYVCGPLVRGAGGRREWFSVPTHIVLDVFADICNRAFVPVEISRQERAALGRHARRNGLPSVESAILSVIEMEMERRERRAT